MTRILLAIFATLWLAGAQAQTQPSLAPNPYDTWVLPELEPLRLWAVASSGRVLRVPEQVEPALEELGDRWFVTFATERSEGGELRPVELRFSARGDFQKKRRAKEVLGLVPDEEPLRYPRWVRSATPPEVAAARLRRVASGDALYGTAIATRDTGDGSSTRIVVATTDGKTRLRLSRVDEQGAVVHRIANVEVAGGRATVLLEPDETSGALVVEDLGSGVWAYLAD